MNCPSCGHENIDGVDRCDECLASFRQLDIPSAEAAEGLARSVMEDNLSRLDQDETISVAPDTPALAVTHLMKNSNSGCALHIAFPEALARPLDSTPGRRRDDFIAGKVWCRHVGWQLAVAHWIFIWLGKGPTCSHRRCGGGQAYHDVDHEL